MNRSAAVYCALFLCLPVLAIAQQQKPDPPPAEFTFTVQYTGGLYGYARIPDVQTFTPPAAAAKNSPAAIAYGELFAKQGSYTLRLGMGDNFAPSLKARTIANPQRAGAFCPVDPDLLVPKDRFYYSTQSKDWFCADQGPGQDPAGNNEIPADNVAQFFIENHYNALVPGIEDFYSGPEWLRSVAHLLGQNGVHMLAANLIISTSKAPDVFAMNTFPRIPPRYAKTAFSTDFGPASLDVPSAVLPYKQQFLVKNARSVSLAGSLVLKSELKGLPSASVTYHSFINDAQVCAENKSSDDRDPNNIPLPGQPNSHCEPLVPSSLACESLGLYPHLQATCESLKEREMYASPDEVYLFQSDKASLSPDTNYLFCAHPAGGDSAPAPGKWSCQPFSVETPFFSWGRNPDDPEVTPFAFVKGDDKTGQPAMAVFGVVDPDILKNVGRINYAYWNDQANLNTAVNVAAPDYSLKQALEFCNKTEACRSARKVLMAQMSLAKASQLMAHFGSDFDLVISQSDADHDSRDASFSDSFDPAKFHLPLLVTAAAPASESSAFKPILSTATIAEKNDSGRTRRTLNTALLSAESIEEISSPAKPCPPTVCLSISQASHAVLSSLHPLSPAPKPNSQALATPASQDVTNLALFVMRRALKTDIALLQKRDLFDVEALSSEYIANHDLQSQLQKIFWKGDFATSFFVKGSTLRAILKQSAAFAALDHDSLASQNDKDRELLTLGVSPDPLDPSTLYVNGAPLVDTLLYSVASSQYLGLGDTGYSVLATPDVPPPYRIEDFKSLKPIGALVCHAIEDSQQYAGVTCDFATLPSTVPTPPAVSTATAAPAPVPAAQTASTPTKQVLPLYFDRTSLRPFDETRGFNTLKHFTLWRRLLADAAPTSGVDGTVQQRAFLSINLEDLDLGYSGTYINHVASSALTFAGISAPGVTTSGTNAINSDHRVRAILDLRHFTFYFVNDSTYMRTSNSGSSVPALSANTLGFEGGGTVRIYHAHRPSLFSFQYATRFQGDLTPQPPTAVTPTLTAAVTTQQPAFYLPVPKSNTLYGRLGLRFDHADTWFETGVEEIDSRHILQQYSFSNGVTCSPAPQTPLACTGGLSIQDPSLMLSGLAAPKFSTGAFLNSGAYLNFKIKIPLWSRLDANHVDQSWYFNLANKGDLYFNHRGDTATQTRLLDKFTPSFTIPLYGGISLTPKVDFILFNNKVLNNHFRAVEPSLSLSYTFAWRQGMEILRTLGFGAITTTAGSPGSLP